MKREYDIGDIAHMSIGRFAKDNNDKRIHLPANAELEVIGYIKMDKTVGSWGYKVKYKGEEIPTEIAQNYLFDKKLWEEYSRLKAELEKTESQ